MKASIDIRRGAQRYLHKVIDLLFRATRSKVANGAIIYTIAGLLNKSVAFLLLPLFTRYLSPRDYGLTAMFLVLQGVVRPFCGILSESAVGRQYYNRRKLDFPVYVSSCLILLPVSAIIVSGVLFLLSNYIEAWTSFPAHWLWAVMVSTAPLNIIMIQLTLWQVQMKAFPYAIIEVANLLLNIGIAVSLVIFCGLAWRARVIGQLVASVFFGCLCFVFLWRNGYVKAKIQRTYIGNALKFSMPLIPHMLGMWAISMTDRLLIANMIDIESAGIYSVGASVSFLMYFGVDSFNKAWLPWCFSALEKNNLENKCKVVRIIYVFDIAVLLVALLAGWFVPKVLPYFVGASFVSSGKYVIWLTVGFAFNGMYKMVCNFLFYIQATQWLPLLTFGTAVLNIVISIALIIRNGAIGAAQGTMIAYLVVFLATWLLTVKLYPMPWVKSLRA